MLNCVPCRVRQASKRPYQQHTHTHKNAPTSIHCLAIHRGIPAGVDHHDTRGANQTETKTSHSGRKQAHIDTASSTHMTQLVIRRQHKSNTVLASTHLVSLLNLSTIGCRRGLGMVPSILSAVMPNALTQRSRIWAAQEQRCQHTQILVLGVSMHTHTCEHLHPACAVTG